MIMPIVDSFTTVPVFLMHLVAMLPLFVVHVGVVIVVVIMVILRKGNASRKQQAWDKSKLCEYSSFNSPDKLLDVIPDTRRCFEIDIGRSDFRSALFAHMEEIASADNPFSAIDIYQLLSTAIGSSDPTSQNRDVGHPACKPCPWSKT